MAGISDMMRANRRRNGRRPIAGRAGFTFVESVAALAILGMVMAGVCRVLISSARTRWAAHNMYVAVIIANNRIERAKNMSADELGLLAERETPVDALGAPDPDGPFTRTTSITRGHRGDARVTRIDVTVHAPPLRFLRNAPRPSESVSTLLTEYLDP